MCINVVDSLNIAENSDPKNEKCHVDYNLGKPALVSTESQTQNSKLNTKKNKSNTDLEHQNLKESRKFIIN